MFSEDDTISTHGEKLRTTDIGGGGGTGGGDWSWREGEYSNLVWQMENPYRITFSQG